MNFSMAMGERQPIHTVYGGAHLFKANTIQRLGEHARRAFEIYAPDPGSFASALGVPPELALPVHSRVREKLLREPVEDYRIDFEDGYGQRSDDEEDQHAALAAREVAEGFHRGALPPILRNSYQASQRTLDQASSPNLAAISCYPAEPYSRPATQWFCHHFAQSGLAG